jgi:hypothetical protein
MTGKPAPGLVSQVHAIPPGTFNGRMTNLAGATKDTPPQRLSRFEDANAVWSGEPAACGLEKACARGRS